MKSLNKDNYIIMFWGTPRTFSNWDIIIYWDKKEALEDSKNNVYTEVLNTLEVPREVQRLLFIQINKEN